MTTFQAEQAAKARHYNAQAATCQHPRMKDVYQRLATQHATWAARAKLTSDAEAKAAHAAMLIRYFEERKK